MCVHSIEVTDMFLTVIEQQWFLTPQTDMMDSL